MRTGDGTSKMILGGVQFGIEYGITNITGQVPPSIVENILMEASAAGITQIDTANGYGNSESVIGQFLQQHPELSFRVITKLSPMAMLGTNSPDQSVISMVDASLSESMESLGLRSLDTVMLHRASHLFDWKRIAWKHLLAKRSQGEIKKLGVSVQTPEELRSALAEDAVSIIQMPFNLLDWRWNTAREWIRETKQNRKVEIHARSVLLQGLLTTSKPEFWHRANMDNSLPVIEWIRQNATRYTDGNIVRLCIEFVRAQDWIDSIVIGITNLVELEENTAYFSTPEWMPEIVNEVEHDRPKLTESTLNPALWK